MTTWKKKTGAEVFIFAQPGDSIEGEVKEIGTGKFENGLYRIETDAGLKTIYGSAVLDARMADVKVGDIVKIVFTGFGKNKNQQQMKLFDVYESDEQAI